MSKIPDIKEATTMSFEEKTSWVAALVTAVVSAVYFWVVFGQLGDVPVTEIAYQGPLVVAVLATVVLTIIGAIVTAVGTAISAKITGGGSVDDIGRTDERDASINRRGELVGYYVSSAGVMIVLGLTMLEYDYFWIANVLYASFLLGTLVSEAVKLVAYRRGY
jgi:hypothetical protein